MEITQLEQQKDKWEKNESNIGDLSDNKVNLIHIIVILEEREKGLVESVFEEITAEIFIDLKKETSTYQPHKGSQTG